MTRYYSSTAAQTTLAGSATAGAATITVAALIGYPSAPFTACIDRGTLSEELVLVTSVSGTTLTVTRGFDGTAGVSHAAGATVEHVHVALDFTECQQHRNATTSIHGITDTTQLATKAPWVDFATAPFQDSLGATVSSSVDHARYSRSTDTVSYRGRATTSATFAAAGALRILLPVAVKKRGVIGTGLWLAPAKGDLEGPLIATVFAVYAPSNSGGWAYLYSAMDGTQIQADFAGSTDISWAVDYEAV